MISSIARVRERLRPLHERPRKTFGHLVSGIVHLVLVVVCVAAWEFGLWPLSVLLWFAIAWMDHAALSRLHESAHRMLYRSSLANELAGVFIGTLSLTPLSVYRYVHLSITHIWVVKKILSFGHTINPNHQGGGGLFMLGLN